MTSAALVAFASNSLLCRLALDRDTIDPASFTAIRLASGAAFLAVVAHVRNRRGTGRGGSWLSALALFAYAACFSFAYVSLDAGAGALILFGAVQGTMIVSGLARGERPQAREWLGALVAGGGLVYLVSPGLSAPPWSGSLWMATAGVAWGIYSLRGKSVLDPLAATADNFRRALLPALLVLVAAWAQSASTPRGVLLAIASGAVASGGGYVVWYAALRGLSATRAATVQLPVPVLTALGGVLVLGEVPTLRLGLASIVVLGGVAFAVSGFQRGRSIP